MGRGPVMHGIENVISDWFSVSDVVTTSSPSLTYNGKGVSHR